MVMPFSDDYSIDYSIIFRTIHAESSATYVWWQKCAIIYLMVSLQKMFSDVLFYFSAVLVDWVQAAHLQGQDDSDHQVRNQGYKSKYRYVKGWGR